MLMPPSVTEIRRPTILQKDAHATRAVREQAKSGALTDFSVFFHLMMTYRTPMMVKDMLVIRRFPENHIYYRCPRCQVLLSQDFMAYCSNCGQCLDWSEYKNAKRTYFKAKR